MNLILATLLILLLSGFFSGMEIAFVSSSKLRVEMDRGTSLTSRALGIYYAHPNHFVSTLLVGNNIALVIYGILMARIVDLYLFDPIGIHEDNVWTLLAQTLISTLIVLVTGEFLPKTLFRINPNGMMRTFALPMFLLYWLLYPVSKFTSALSKLALRLSGVRMEKPANEGSFKKVDLDYLIQTNIDGVGGESEVTEEVRFFQNALEFSSTKVRDCIVPRTEIAAVSRDASRQELLQQFIESGHSKVIVYREDIDDIVGYVHSSELFRLKADIDWTQCIHELPIVPETMTAHRLMQQFMQQKKSLAVVVDEFGGTSGIVALEDLVEEIFGEIEDEHDNTRYVAKKTAGGEYILSARLEIEKVNELFDLSLPEGEDYLTVGGLILHQCQRFPKLNEVVRFGRWEVKILKSRTTKIELVRLKVVS